MSHSTWGQDERAFGSVNPAVINQKAHRTLNHIENIVFSMGVRPGALRVRLQPPLGDGISTLRFVSVCFEDGANASHWVRTPLAWMQKNAGAFRAIVLDAHVSSQIT